MDRNATTETLRKWEITEQRNMKNEMLTERIIGAAIEVHRELGPGLLESVYEECLCNELSLMALKFERQKELPIVYKGTRVGGYYRIDLLVENAVILELKSVEALLRVHEAQVLTYMRMSGIDIGLLLNFNVDILKNGIKRFVI
jgi:GxxExxY protein